MTRGCFTALMVALVAGLPVRPVAAEVAVDVTYLRQEVDRPPVLSNLDPVPEDLGLAGAELARADSQTTGDFLGHHYRLEIVSVAPGGDVVAAARAALSRSRLMLLEAEPAALLAVADLPEAAGALLFNVASGDAALRSADCRANLLHTAAEEAALGDALMQFLQTRQWRRTVLVRGPKPADRALAESFRASARKFGVQILAEKDWTFDTDLRESTLQEIPRFLQDFPEHDILLVADATDDFGRYIPDNTWIPRPVAGSHGLVPLGWSTVIEAWGAVQLQERFEARAGRDMRSTDYAAWLALRAIAEGVTRTGSADPARLRAFLLDPGLQLDGFKGRGLSFRAWNGQLRQPIALANAGALVAMAPLPGFLHQRNEMDSLGLDQPESACTAFGAPP